MSIEKEKIELFVVSHTHWDREWYQTFQDFRYRLVRMIDNLINILEKDSDYKCFHFDGQTIMLEDYLQIRPQNEERIKKLIKDGRIIIGPWYVMPDEFLISGESLVRNLQKGFEICEDYGVEPMKNGYVVDIFGHNAQFPQILKGFGIETATLFRGIADYPKDTFTWQGADGSEVTTFKLCKDRSYSNYYFSVREPFNVIGYTAKDEEIIQRVKQMLENSKAAGTCEAYLLLDGVDHIDADPELPKVISLIQKSLPNVSIKHATLEEYIERIKQLNPKLDTIKGPLYNIGNKGLNNIVVRNVLSSMVHLKQQNDKCETMLTGWAEPLDLYTHIVSKNLKTNELLCYGEPRQDYFAQAWRYLMMNHPHDSICGCSYSEVHKDNEYRFRQSEQIAQRMVDDAMEQISDNVDTSKGEGDYAFVVYNTNQDDIDEYLILDLALPPNLYHNFKLFDENGNEIAYQILDIGDLYYNAKTPVLKLVCFDSNQKIKVACKLFIKANGYTTIFVKTYNDVGPGAHEYKKTVEYDKTRYLGTMRTSLNTWDNGKLNIEVAQNGTLTVINKRTAKTYYNVLSFEDCADLGEGWTYVKPQCDSEYLSICGESDVSVESDGPFAAVLKITRRMTLPKNIKGTHRSKERDILEIVSIITLLKGSSILSIKTEVDNHLTDHRLRVLFPTGLDAKYFYTSTPYDMQKWDVKKADWSTFKEAETFVNPSQGCTLVTDGKNSVEVYSKGLYELEVSEINRTIALTLFRSFNNEFAQISSELGVMKRSMKFEYAVSFNEGRKPYEALRSSLKWKKSSIPFRTTLHKGALPSSMSFVSIYCNSTVLSAMYKDNSSNIIVRLYNPSDESDDGCVELPCNISKAEYVNFEGRTLGEVKIKDNKAFIGIAPRKIITVLLQKE